MRPTRRELLALAGGAVAVAAVPSASLLVPVGGVTDPLEGPLVARFSDPDCITSPDDVIPWPTNCATVLHEPGPKLPR